MRSVAPIWSDALGAPQPPFPGSRVRADLAIIGGGLAGLSAAYHLLARRPAARVVVLEASRIGAGASGRSTGMVSPGVGQSLTALVRRIGAARASSLYRASLRAVGAVEHLVAEERIECQLRMSGQLVVARDRSSRGRLRVLAETLDRLALPGTALDDHALARRIRLAEPASGGEGPAAVALPVAGTLHPGRLLAGLARRVVERGGVIFEGARVAAIGDRRPVRLAMVGGGEVLADEVVVATAGYTPELGLLRGRILPVHLQVLVTDPLDLRARASIGWAGREGVVDARRLFSYFRLSEDHRIVFGGGAPRYRWAGRTDETGTDAALDRLELDLQRTFPAAARLRITGGWGGLIGYVADALPAIHRSQRNPGVVHAVGWCGHGVALAAAAGDWVAQLLCDGAAPEDLPWYRDDPPLVPFEPVRWLGFRATVAWMAALDRFA